MTELGKQEVVLLDRKATGAPIGHGTGHERKATDGHVNNGKETDFRDMAVMV